MKLMKALHLAAACGLSLTPVRAQSIDWAEFTRDDSSISAGNAVGLGDFYVPLGAIGAADPGAPAASPGPSRTDTLVCATASTILRLPHAAIDALDADAPRTALRATCAARRTRRTASRERRGAACRPQDATLALNSSIISSQTST